MNTITIVVEVDGTQTWTNRDRENGDEIRYIFTPKAQLSPGDRAADTEAFRRRSNGNGLERFTVTGQGVLSQNDINALPNGSFVRLGPRPGQGDRGGGE